MIRNFLGPRAPQLNMRVRPQNKIFFRWTTSILLASSTFYVKPTLEAKAQVMGVDEKIVQPYYGNCFAAHTWSKRRSGYRMPIYFRTAADETQSNRWITASDPQRGSFLFQLSGCNRASATKREVLIKNRGSWAGAHIEIVDCPSKRTREQNSAQWMPAPSQLVDIACE